MKELSHRRKKGCGLACHKPRESMAQHHHVLILRAGTKPGLDAPGLLRQLVIESRVGLGSSGSDTHPCQHVDDAKVDFI